MPTLHAEELRNRIAKQIADDIKQDKAEICKIIDSMIVSMQSEMLTSRSMTYVFTSESFALIRESCRGFAIQLLIKKLRDLHFRTNGETDSITVTCE